MRKRRATKIISPETNLFIFAIPRYLPKKLILSLYILLLVTTTVYSYSLVDLNLTFFNSELWNNFRSYIIQFGYFNRPLSFSIYATIIVLLFVFHFIFLKRENNPLTLALIVGGITLFSYPFLSHDFLKYLFDAKIVTFYHQNPYVYKPLDFPNDPWIRFLHWTHQSYRYGPFFLFLAIIPSFLSFGKFIFSFLFFKLMFAVFYFLSVYYLQKLNKKWAILLATHPLIIIEGLVNSHNDILSLSLAIFGIFFLYKKRNIVARLLLLFSFGIKYITLPLLFLSQNKNAKINRLIFVALLFLPFIFLNNFFLSLFGIELHTWYFLTLFAFIPFWENLIFRLNIFFAGLLISYYPYIRLGGWDTAGKVALKQQIIVVFFIANLFFLFYQIILKKMKFRL